jgi:hypothetical protein
MICRIARKRKIPLGKRGRVMNEPFRTAYLGIGAIALAWLPCAALAVDVVAANLVTVTDAVTGSGSKLVAGRKLKISCKYSYPQKVGKPLSWKVQLEVDGKVIGTPNATLPPPVESTDFDHKTLSYYNPPSFSASAIWTTAIAGVHTAKCTLDPEGRLRGWEMLSHTENNVQQTSFTVDVTPLAPPGAAQGPQPKVLDPDLRIALAARVLPNCAPGQDVVRISGTIRNAGSGYAIIPPGKAIVEIESKAGVHGGTIATGNLAPGQAQQVSVTLKPKALPVSLAGATLKFRASIIPGVIKDASAAGNQKELTVVFPANYCKQASGSSTTPRARAAPDGPAKR